MISASTTPGTLDRAALRERYLAGRNRTAEIFALIDPAAITDRPIPLRHPFIFYEGHIPAFSFSTLVRRALGRPSLDPRFEKLFERGIDPRDVDAARAHELPAWPDRYDVKAFGARCDEAVLRALAHDVLTEGSPQLERGQAVFTILEHEEMHQETLLYLIHQLDAKKKRRPRTPLDYTDRALAPAGRVAVAAGRATLGAQRDRITFGWDNEFDETVVDVGAFEIDVDNVTNGEYLAFVRAGGPLPPFWVERDGTYALRTLFDEIALPQSWPVYATQQQATAYARWRGARIATEAEYHRAAFGAPGGEERAFPWGDAMPRHEHGNFGFRRYDPEPVGSSPAGASAWGVRDLIGNGWEWTSTPFAPFPGFEPMASYPQYSADFFDGKHYIIKGGSPVTALPLIRRSLRNWFYADYPHMYATFRCVYD